MLQVDKLYNPFTLLVGPCFVAYIIYKTTIPVEDGGYHLPWWYVFSDLPSLRVLTDI